MTWPEPTFPILKSSTPFNKSCPWLKPNTCFYPHTSYIFPAPCHCSSYWWQPSPLSPHSKVLLCFKDQFGCLVLHGAVLSTWALSPVPPPKSGIVFCIPVLLHDFLPCLMLISIHYLCLYLISLTFKNDHWELGFCFIFSTPKVLSKFEFGRMLQWWNKCSKHSNKIILVSVCICFILWYTSYMCAKILFMLYFTKFAKPRMANKEGQNMLPHNVLLWHIDYFELKADSRCRKGSLPSSFLPKSKA